MTFDARAAAHAMLAAMKLPCGYFAEDRDEGDGWVRMANPTHAKECERLTVAFQKVYAEGRANERAALIRGGEKPPCKDCGKPSDDTCPLCGKSVCQLCAEREGESCCDG